MAILGIDIGGTKTTVLLGQVDGTIIDRLEFQTLSHRGEEAFRQDIAQAVSTLKKQKSSVVIECVSVAVGGPMDEASGALLAPPHLSGFEELNLKSLFSELFSLPVYVMHDARASAFAEYTFGAGKLHDTESLAHFTFATGFGCAVVMNGRLLSIPGEVGHWRVAESGPNLFGKQGSLEGLASGAGILIQAKDADDLPSTITLPELAGLARNGNKAALRIFDDAAVQVGRQCARLIDLLGPQVITLGTLGIHLKDLVMDRIIEVTKEEALPHLMKNVVLQPAQLAEKLGDVSSLSAAISAGHQPSNQGPSVEAQLRGMIGLGERIHASPHLMQLIQQAVDQCSDCIFNGGKIFTAGNGGSATDAAHLAEELIGRYRINRRPFPAISLGADSSALTCIGNDYGFDSVFSRQIEALGTEGDVLVLFSTSGNSPNITQAIKSAKLKKVRTIALLGKDGGEAATLADHSIIIPSMQSERIQEFHTFILHAICEAIEAKAEDQS